MIETNSDQEANEEEKEEGRWVLSPNEMSRFWLPKSAEDIEDMRLGYIDDPPGHIFPEVEVMFYIG